MGTRASGMEYLLRWQVRAPIRISPSPHPALATQLIRTEVTVGLRPSFHGLLRRSVRALPVPSPQARNAGPGRQACRPCSGKQWAALLPRDVQLSGEAALFSRRLRVAVHLNPFHRTHLPTTPQRHGHSCAHRFVRHAAAGRSRSCSGYPEQPAGGRRSSITWPLTTIRRAMGTFATCWKRDAAAFRRPMPL